MEIKWHDIDPDSGQPRYLCAERFAGVWKFRWKLQRRGEWTRGLEPTCAMWEHVPEDAPTPPKLDSFMGKIG